MRRAFVPVILLAMLSAFGRSAGTEQAPPAFEPAEVLATEEAAYPVIALFPGTVVLEVLINPAGEIAEVKVVRDAPPFTQEALRAVKKWKFKPAKLDGRAIASRLPVAFSFSRPAVWWRRNPQ